jgi:hypothetical protein
LEVKMKDEQEQSRMDQGTNPRLKGNAKQKEVQEWTLDLYWGQASGTKGTGDEEDTLEINLEEEEAEVASECVAIVV